MCHRHLRTTSRLKWRLWNGAEFPTRSGSTILNDSKLSCLAPSLQRVILVNRLRYRPMQVFDLL